MITKELKIINNLGLHARAAAKVVSTANKFESKIMFVKDDKNADARSIMKLLMLSASKGSCISVKIDGIDQNDAMSSIEKLFENKFDEEK
tara:strand:- start:221 stop:490 length:270 start_codon:yes stop_codon:yes gene_type:complete